MVKLLEKIQNWIKSGDTSSPINKTCHDPAKDMVDCVSGTKCFSSGKTLKECSRDDEETAITCKKQINEWYLCRKFSVNHSKHFLKDTYK
jgi:Cytochrome c oxidase assembly protein PET191